MLGLLFSCQKLTLALDAPAIAGNRAVFPDDTMAWHEDRDRIGGNGLCHFAGITRAQLRRKSAVTGCLTDGQCTQHGPHLELIRRSTQI